jgi:hypothetical protein
VLSFKLRGVKAMRRRVAQVSAKLDAQAHRALDLEGRAVLRSAIRMAPFEDGELRKSALQHPVRREGRDLVTVLTFGEQGPSAAYALALHETPSPHDPPSWVGVTVTFHTPGTGPKYLETPLRQAVSGMADRVAKRVHLG